LIDSGEGGSVTTEAEIEVKRSQIKGCRLPPAASGSQERTLLGASRSRETVPTPTDN
jgi:hypothetical protein